MLHWSEPSSTTGEPQVVGVLPNTNGECGVDMFLQVCHSLGKPTALDNREGPSTFLTFLELQLNKI